MPRSFLRTAFLSLAGLATAAVVGLFATLACLFAAEDYVVQPGSPMYYVGISPVIRSLKAPQGAVGREYFGSVGDGNKAPQSQLGFDVAQHTQGEVWKDLDAQLRRQGLQPVTTMAVPADARRHPGTEAAPPTEAEYRSAQHELVLVSAHWVQRAGAADVVRFSITHFD